MVCELVAGVQQQPLSPPPPSPHAEQEVQGMKDEPDRDPGEERG